MAKQIKETPILEGKFARELEISIEKDIPDQDKLDYLDECKKTYRALMLL